MNCQTFRTQLATGADTTEMREHLRECPSCLEAAVETSPDFLFRSLGGEMIPPGGVDEFVSEVMQQVHVRSAEQRIARRPLSPIYRWSLAAAFAMTVLTSLIVNRTATIEPVTTTIASARPIATRPADRRAVAARPVVENYSATAATIVEIPTEETGDLKVVMIFDESLPADL